MMRVLIGITLGQSGCHFAKKELDLHFAPTPGMQYHDGTWKDTQGRKITSVLIENIPDEKPYLSVQLEADESDAAEALVSRYRDHGWNIDGEQKGMRKKGEPGAIESFSK